MRLRLARTHWPSSVLTALLRTRHASFPAVRDIVAEQFSQCLAVMLTEDAYLCVARLRVSSLRTATACAAGAFTHAPVLRTGLRFCAAMRRKRCWTLSRRASLSKPWSGPDSDTVCARSTKYAALSVRSIIEDAASRCVSALRRLLCARTVGLTHAPGSVHHTWPASRTPAICSRRSMSQRCVPRLWSPVNALPRSMFWLHADDLPHQQDCILQQPRPRPGGTRYEPGTRTWKQFRCSLRAPHLMLSGFVA